MRPPARPRLNVSGGGLRNPSLWAEKTKNIAKKNELLNKCFCPYFECCCFIYLVNGRVVLEFCSMDVPTLGTSSTQNPMLIASLRTRNPAGLHSARSEPTQQGRCHGSMRLDYLPTDIGRKLAARERLMAEGLKNFWRAAKADRKSGHGS